MSMHQDTIIFSDKWGENLKHKKMTLLRVIVLCVYV